LTETNLRLQQQSYRDKPIHTKLHIRSYTRGITITKSQLQTRTYRYGDQRGTDENLFKADAGLLGRDTKVIKRDTDLFGRDKKLLETIYTYFKRTRPVQKR